MSGHRPSNSAIDDVRIGQVFAERYEIIRRIGTGGMAVVYGGRDRMLQRDVAIKILKPAVMDDPSAVERLRREARAAGQLHHRHIITFHDVGMGEGAVFIVMELLRGRTLAAERRRCQRLDSARVARIGAQVASALRVVHAAGIIHRDLKPDNIFLLEHAGDDFSKLLDFSIAKLPATLVDGRITQTGTVHGTPQYMPPEQAIGDPVSPASDIYALGAVLFEMIVGKAPFHATNVLELLAVQSTEDAPRVRTLEPDCPEALETLIAQMLARQPHQRPVSAEAVEQALAEIVAECLEKGTEPPPLPHGKKKLADAAKTARNDVFEPPSDITESPTVPLDKPLVTAPSALHATSSKAKPKKSHSSAVARPKSVKSRAVARRTGSSKPTRRTTQSRSVKRASARPGRGTTPPKKKTRPLSAQVVGKGPSSTAPRIADDQQRGKRSTLPSWSGQTSPDNPVAVPKDESTNSD
ncbi:MAG: protein kinase [Myxococcales bacterium]|nr:protein kinase [Myxococcales bacterium]